MKQRWIFRILGVTLALLCFSCTGFFEIGGEETIEPYDNPEAAPTYVVFNNTANRNCAVDVFSSSTRNSPIISVARNAFSSNLSWVATDADGYNFFLTYNFMFEGNKIPFIPPIDSPANYVNVRINRGQTNTVIIPSLSTSVNPSTRLSNDIWLLIKNNGTSQLRLISGTTTVPNENRENTIDVGKTGLYKLPSDATPTFYKMQAGPVTADVPLLQFNHGSVHEITFDGTTTAVWVKTTELTINSLL